MKNIILASALIVFAGIASGQKTVDQLMKARAFAESGQYNNAIGVLSAAIGSSEESSLLMERAEAYIYTGDLSAALNDLNSANRITPGLGEYGLARVYAMRRDVSTSLYHLERHLTSAFKKSERVILLDPAFSNIENRPEWRQFWRREWYTGYERQMAEIEYYSSRGNTDQARTILRSLTADYPGNSENLYAAALVDISAGNLSGAAKSLAELTAKHPSEERYLRLYAHTQEDMRNPSGASVTYTRLISMNIPDAGLYLSRAECYRKTGEFSKARADAASYLGFYNDSKKGLSLAGRIESDAGDNLRALEYFSRNVILHPNDQQCYVDRANTYFLSRSWDRAINDYAMSLDLMPDNPEAWLNKGISLLNSGRRDDACLDFRRAFRLGEKRATEYISRNCIR